MVRLTCQQKHFFELRFNRGLKQREIAPLLAIKVPAVSRRERRIKDKFLKAGLPEPISPGRSLLGLSCRSL